jgi:tetratricopeptide (TPR) repeat protein
MKGMIKEAKENAVKAIKLNPQKAMYRNSYALIFLKEGNYDGAIRESRAAIKLNKDFHAPFAIMGAAYRLKGDYLRSMLCWQNYIRYAPDNMGAHLALIELYNLDNRKDLLAQTVVNMLYISNGRKIADLIEYERLKDATYVPEREVILPIIQETLRQIESQLNNDQVHK